MAEHAARGAVEDRGAAREVARRRSRREEAGRGRARRATDAASTCRGAAAPDADALPQHPHTREHSDDSHRSSPSPPHDAAAPPRRRPSDDDNRSSPSPPADAKPEKRRRKPSPRPQEPPRDFGVMDTVEGNWNDQGRWYTAVVEGVFADGTINLK